MRPLANRIPRNRAVSNTMSVWEGEAEFTGPLPLGIATVGASRTLVGRDLDGGVLLQMLTFRLQERRNPFGGCGIKATIVRMWQFATHAVIESAGAGEKSFVRDRQLVSGSVLFLEAMMLAASLFSAPSWAQEPQPAGNPPAQQPSQTADKGKDSPDKDKKDEKQAPATSNDRLFWTLPNFLTVENAGRIPPLTAGQKFKVVARGSFDPIEYPYVAFLSGISQAENSEPGYGQGAAGYGKRFGAAFADNTIENFMTGAVLPSLLKEDPRYYQLGKGGFFHRTGYAVSRIFVTRTDSGRNRFNVSEVAGSAIAAGMSIPYHPADDRTVSNTMSIWGFQVMYDTLTVVIREFWPDIRRKFRKK